ncbi:MAG: virB8 [Rickettsiaceae bacterium]|jgi:type IV secretory pathway component VirB8|nr:virB8 [Rickettsiaceae bacterium]
MTDLTPEEQKEYNDFIKASVEDGSYFKDALDWYLLRCVQPVCERTMLFFIAIVTGFISYVLIIAIINALPIRQQVPIVVRAKDQSRYFPVIKKLKDSDQLKNIDEAVAKYLLTGYIQKRESYDFRKSDIQALNNRLNYIKNNSSAQEYAQFQSFLNKDTNPESPLTYFGKDFQRLVDIDSVKFSTKSDDASSEQNNYLVFEEVPVNAQISYTLTTKINSVTTSTQKYLAKISFKFSGVATERKPNSKLDFIVTSYKIYKVK